MMWGDGEPMMLTVAEALGLEPDAFYTALHDGQTLAEIAEAQGVELEAIYDAALAHVEEHLAWMRETLPKCRCSRVGASARAWAVRLASVLV